MKTLLAITTYNQLEYTKKLIDTLKLLTVPNLDIIFIDDLSKDGTQEFIKSCGYTLIERNTPKGLTCSWNIAYRKFKKENYDYLIISNNDVLLCNDSIINLINSCKGTQLSCPLSTKNGAGHNWREQSIHIHYPKLDVNPTIASNFLEVQKQLINKKIKISKFNGFIFCLSRKIIQSEFNKDNLINPKLINVGQESDLGNRLIEQPMLSLGSFVYHYKGVSFHKKGLVNGKDIRQNLKLYH